MKAIDYKQQARDIAKQIGLKMNVEFLRHDKHFADDKDARDIYKITLTKDGRYYSFNFGQSINCSGQYVVAPHLRNKLWCEQTTGGKYALTEKEYKSIPGKGIIVSPKDIYKNEDFAEPDLYSVICCLTKHDPGTFEIFCSDFGYDEDSRKAEKIYKAVCDEWANVQRLFNDEELELLQEIQ